MLQNVYAECNICKTITRLRIQIGYFDCPVFYACPECGTEISGLIKISQEFPHVAFNLENATITSNTNSRYVAEQSVEFMQKKICEETKYFDLTPFMRSIEFINFDNNPLARTMLFINFTNEGWQKYKTQIQLFENDKFDLLINTLKKEPAYQQFEIKHKLDAFVIMHHNFISGIANALPSNTLQKYCSFSQEILNLFINKQNELTRFINDFEAKNIFKISFVKINQLIDDFCKLGLKLMPIIVLINENKFEHIDRNEFGISTISYTELNKYYADSYEEILKLLDIILALNNIRERNAYDNMISNSDFDTFEKYINAQNKFKKLNLVQNDEFFSRVLALNNRIRNAINHYDVEINYNKQLITYTDKYGGKSKKQELYYIDLAKMCVENFSFLIYLYEIIYQLRKISIILKCGLKPNINYDCIESNAKDKSKKKIGRNDLCPCGSGKKYKKCCGK